VLAAGNQKRDHSLRRRTLGVPGSRCKHTYFSAQLWSTKAISVGEEIFGAYGAGYWYGSSTGLGTFDCEAPRADTAADTSAVDPSFEAVEQESSKRRRTGDGQGDPPP
jgi:hypothetical protein